MTEQSKPPTQQLKSKAYVGRFAPSPSGPLHFGSLLTAIASYLDARAHQGKFLLRIDNIDPPREIEGASEDIIQCLQAFSLNWDGEVIYQSDRYPLYLDFLITLIKNDLVYPCECSRKQLADHSQYPGTCRKILSTQQKQSLIDELLSDSEHVLQKGKPSQLIPLLSHYSLRLNTQDFKKEKLDFIDSIQGSQHYPEDFGDFILLRKDRLPSYMLACAVDDIYDGITHIIRGNDLLESTFWQRCLQTYFLELDSQRHSANMTLDFHYGHLPVITNELNQKLSKQHHAPAVNAHEATQTLLSALRALNQQIPDTIAETSISNILSWATEHWRIEKIPAENIVFNSLKG